jgi:hypothetical protein
VYITEPKLMHVFINAPPPRKHKKKEAKEGKDKAASKGYMKASDDDKKRKEKERAEAEDKDALFTESKFGVFFEASGELIHEKTVWPISRHNPLHCIRLRDEAI